MEIIWWRSWLYLPWGAPTYSGSVNRSDSSHLPVLQTVRHTMSFFFCSRCHNMHLYAGLGGLLTLDVKGTVLENKAHFCLKWNLIFSCAPVGLKWQEDTVWCTAEVVRKRNQRLLGAKLACGIHLQPECNRWKTSMKWSNSYKLKNEIREDNAIKTWLCLSNVDVKFQSLF